MLKKNIYFGHKVIDCSIRRVMGILNITPYSFFNSHKYYNKNYSYILKKVEFMLKYGATFIDIGGYSTRPNHKNISLNEELFRVIPVINIIKKKFPDTILSVDTFRSEVALEAINYGVSIINDVSGMVFDKKMIKILIKFNIPYVLTHNHIYHFYNFKKYYNDIILDINNFFCKRLNLLNKLGVNNIILDPGFGFAKGIKDNVKIIKYLSLIKKYDKYPILLGLSRKSTVQKLVNSTANDCLNATTILHVLALLNGASILRVHDVKEAFECINIIDYYYNVN